jgi:hypothetical protein
VVAAACGAGPVAASKDGQDIAVGGCPWHADVGGATTPGGDRRR